MYNIYIIEDEIFKMEDTMMKKRILTAAMLAALLLSAAACGDTDASQAGTTGMESGTAAPAETEIPKLPESVEQIDMNGFEFKIKHFSQEWLSWAKNTLDVEEQDGDLFNDAIYDRNRTIEELFNCTITVESVKNIAAGDVQTEVMAGDSNYDIWYNYDIWVLDAIAYLMPWENLVNVDLTQPWWNPMATDVFNIGGSHYAAAGNFSLSVLSRASGFTFNKSVYSELGMEKSLYDIVADNEWTVDKMQEICILAYSDINGDGQMDENDRYGVNGSYKELYARWILGSGINYVTIDDEGFPVFTLPSDSKAIDKIQHIYELFSDPRTFNPNDGSIAETSGKGSLEKNTLLFNNDNLIGLENKRNLDIDIGFVPTPKYDASQDHYYAPSFGAEIAVLLKTLPEDRWENVGILMESLCYYSDQFVIPMYKEVLLKTKYARDSESEAMIDIIIDSVSFEFGLNAWQNTVANPFVEGAIVKSDGNIASTLEKMTKSVETQIKKLRTVIEDNQ